MKPLIIFASLILAVANGKPGGTCYYPASIPSAPPCLLPNWAAPFPSFAPSEVNIPSAPVASQVVNIPSASVAPFYNLPLPTPPSPSGSSVDSSQIINIGTQSLTLQPVEYQSVEAQQLTGRRVEAQTFRSPVQSLSIEQPQPEVFPQRFNFIQAVPNFGGLLPIGSPQVPLNSYVPPQEPLPVHKPVLPSRPSTPEVNQAPPQVNVASVTIPNVARQPPSYQKTDYVIQKHVYFHVPPEDPQVRRPPKPIVVPPRIHYRLIFIKAPTAPEPTAPAVRVPVPVQPQDEERTIIYILVKRPEEPEIKIQPPPTTPPSKPEVYFIRYDTKKESVPSEPVSTDNGNTIAPVVEDVAKGSIIVRGGNTEPNTEQNTEQSTEQNSKNVALNLNEASLTGGSALSLAVTGNPEEESKLFVSNTPPTKYDPGE